MQENNHGVRKLALTLRLYEKPKNIYKLKKTGKKMLKKWVQRLNMMCVSWLGHISIKKKSLKIGTFQKSNEQ